MKKIFLLTVASIGMMSFTSTSELKTTDPWDNIVRDVCLEEALSFQSEYDLSNSETAAWFGKCLAANGVE